MSSLGIVVVSHSENIAKGIVQLIREVAKDVAITYAGGNNGEIGTSFDAVLNAVEQNAGEKLLTFFDLGSARMNLDMVKDFVTKEMTIYTVPVVEGAYTAAALIQAGAPLEAIEAQLESMKIEK